MRRRKNLEASSQSSYIDYAVKDENTCECGAGDVQR